MADVEDRLAAVENLLEQTNSWIAQKLRPGIQSLKEAMQSQINELREQLEAERAARAQLQKQLDSRPDLAAIKSLIQEQLKSLPAAPAAAEPPASSSSPSWASKGSPASRAAVESAPKDDLFDAEPDVRSASSTRTRAATTTARPTSFIQPSSSASHNRFLPPAKPSAPAAAPAPAPTPAPAAAPAPSKSAASSATAELEKRLEDNNLEKYYVQLVNGGVTSLAKLATLQAGDLARFGVMAAGHKKLFGMLIAELQEELGAPAAQPAPPSEVEQKLKSVGLERYAAAFSAQGIKTLKQLADLDSSRYGSVGVTLPAHQKKLATLVLSLATDEEDGGDDESMDLFPGPKPSSTRTAAPLFQEPQARPATTTAAAPRPTSSYGGSGSGSGAARRGGSGESGAIKEAVDSIRDDSTDTDWLLIECTRDGSLAFEASGSGGFDEFIDYVSDAKIQYGLLRLIQGDQESKRVKFVFVRWVGPSCPTILKAKANTLKNDVMRLVGQFHVEIFAEDIGDLTLDVIKGKLKAAAGADYDQGNKDGYTSSAGSIRARALDTYRSKERESTIGKPIFESYALPSTTPCDISNRPFVAPKTEALSNIRDLKTGAYY